MPGIVETIGFAAALLSTFCWLPQAIKVLRDKETRAISLPGMITMIIAVALWLAYGFALHDWPLIAANAVSLSLMVPILMMKLRHG